MSEPPSKPKKPAFIIPGAPGRRFVDFSSLGELVPEELPIDFWNEMARHNA